MLLDTSGLMCLFDKRDRRHEAAKMLYLNAQRRLTHNYVLAEFVALAAARRAPRDRALGFLMALTANPLIEIVWVDERAHRAALEFLSQRLDKSWSLCDAASFLLMQPRNETEALTTDHHFEQAGFVRLLDQ